MIPPAIGVAQVDLTPETVLWFLDGRRLLRHAHDLHLVRAKLVCVQCETHGNQTDEVHVVVDASQARAVVACPHRPTGGVVRLDRELEVTPLLLALGWGLRCSMCRDALRGDNDPATAITFHVTCLCTSRNYALPVA